MSCDVKAGREELALLYNKVQREEVDRRLQYASISIGSRFRRPGTLHERKGWKASEWKVFVLELILVVLDGSLPYEIMNGWAMIVQLCNLLCRWILSEGNITNIGAISRKFYNHFSETSYRCHSSRVKMYKYVYHLLLHCEESTRHCGPLSLLSLWPIKFLVGVNNRRCTATVHFVQSIVEKLKLFQSVRLYWLREDIDLPWRDGEEGPRQSLTTLGADIEVPVFSMRHAKLLFPFSAVSTSLNVEIHSLLSNYYLRLGPSSRPT